MPFFIGDPRPFERGSFFLLLYNYALFPHKSCIKNFLSFFPETIDKLKDICYNVITVKQSEVEIMRTYKFNEVCKTKTEEEIYDLFATASIIVSKLNVEPLYPIDAELKYTKSVRKLGLCSVNHTRQTTSIYLTDSCLLLDDDMILNTLIHELLHTLPNCQDHKFLWKTYAGRIQKMTGINISRVANVKDLTSKINYKYIVKCRACGAEWGYGRMAKIVENPSEYRCRCKGEIERIR